MQLDLPLESYHPTASMHIYPRLPLIILDVYLTLSFSLAVIKASQVQPVINQLPLISNPFWLPLPFDNVDGKGAN